MPPIDIYENSSCLKRTLIVTGPYDNFVVKLLQSCALGAWEPLSVDILRFGIPLKAPEHENPKISCSNGVVEYSCLSLDSLIEPSGASLDSLLQSYERIAVLSIHPSNADLINHIATRFKEISLSCICTDDEIDRHFKFKTAFEQHPDLVEHLRERLLYPVSVEQAFENLKHFFIGSIPWESMLRKGRKAEFALVPFNLPIVSKLPAKTHEHRPDDSYTVVLFPKPWGSDEEFVNALNCLISANFGYPIRIITFRNNFSTRTEAKGVTIVCYPSPLPSEHYYNILATADGIIALPRGGITATRDAVRLGLDVMSLFPESPNDLLLRFELGLHLTDYKCLKLADPENVKKRRRIENKMKLAAYDFSAIHAFRREYF